MEISQGSASHLCERLIKSLIEWPSLHAALQSGGLEVKASNQIHDAIQKLLPNAESKHLLIREYRGIDYAIIHRDSIGQARLKVAAAIEVKFNFASQAIMRTRVTDAIAQVLRYREKVSADSAYVLYFIVSPSSPITEDGRDSGWKYWAHTPEVAKVQLELGKHRICANNQKILAEMSGVKDNILMYCALLKV